MRSFPAETALKCVHDEPGENGKERSGDLSFQKVSNSPLTKINLLYNTPRVTKLEEPTNQSSDALNKRKQHATKNILYPRPESADL